MLYFSKLKILAIYFIIIFLSIFSITNFINNDENFFLSKKVNLGLDLQGGSYLLLEVDSNPVIKQKLQNKLVILRKELKKDNIKYQNLKRGDEVVTSGGIVGRVERIIGDDKVDILIAENVTVQVVQSTIQALLSKPQTKK